MCDAQGPAPDAPAHSLQAGPGPLHPRRQLEHRVRQLAQAMYALSPAPPHTRHDTRTRHAQHTLTTAAHASRCVRAVAAGAHQRGGGQDRSPAAAGQAGRIRAPDRALLRHLLRVRHLARTLHHRTPHHDTHTHTPAWSCVHCPTPSRARVVWHCRDSTRATTSSSSPSPSLGPSVAVRHLFFIYLFMN